MATTLQATPFELVDDLSRTGEYEGPERRRLRPHVRLSDRLSGARRDVWQLALGRLVLVLLLWTSAVSPQVDTLEGVLGWIAPILVYAFVEVLAVGICLKHFARVARAASLY